MKIKRSELKQIAQNKLGDDSVESQNKILLMISTARCARLSYMTFDNEIDYNKDIELHNRLLQSGHYSPFEHCAKAMSDNEYYSFIKGNFNQEIEIDADGFIDISTHSNNSNSFGWCNNFKGFIQYRYLIENKK